MQSAWRSQPLRTKAKPQNTNSSYVLETKSSKRNPQNGVSKFRCKTQTARWDLYQTLSCYDPILVPNSRRRTVTKVRRLRHGLRTLVSARVCVGNGCLGIWAPERATVKWIIPSSAAIGRESSRQAKLGTGKADSRNEIGSSPSTPLRASASQSRTPRPSANRSSANRG